MKFQIIVRDNWTSTDRVRWNYQTWACIYLIYYGLIRSVGNLIKAYILIPLIVSAAVIALDSYVYGRFIVTLLDSFNATAYMNGDRYPWYWYLTLGFPTILGTSSILFGIAAEQTLRRNDIYRKRCNILIAILFTLGIYSCFPNKDYHFISILLPLCLYITGDALQIWSHKLKQYQILIIALLILYINAKIVFKR